MVRRADGTERIFNVKYFVFATGVGDGYAELPKYPGMVRLERRDTIRYSRCRRTSSRGRFSTRHPTSEPLIMRERRSLSLALVLLVRLVLEVYVLIAEFS